MKNKRVFLIRNTLPANYGGGETYQIKLGLMLLENGFEPYIITVSEGLLDDAKKKGMKVIESPYIDRQNWSGWRNILFPVYFMKIMKLRRQYRKLFKKYRPAVVNIQSRDDWIAATPVAKKMGIRVLWTDHMDFRSWVLTNINIWYKNWIGRWLLHSARKADRIIMISDYEKKTFENLVGKDKSKNVEVIKNGAKDELKRYDNIRVMKNTFCYVGRIVDYKGIWELVEAFKIVVKKYSNAKLNIYGEGEVEKYKKMCDGCNGIVFHGRTEEPLKVLAENEAFVLPSYREGLSLSLLDAAMMGKKIIASDVDGNPEVVVDGETGLLVPAKDAEKLAEAMIWMLEHRKEANEMAEKARKRYEKDFDFEKIFEERMLPLYNNKKEKK
ncbi:glycosyltransferase family 4 protein [Candidatus Saccharibacteria bacterium]|nr:glycosyltransferase family 4 protein [Candidatus Saccharibacteria bacterium]